MAAQSVIRAQTLVCGVKIRIRVPQRLGAAWRLLWPCDACIFDRFKSPQRRVPIPMAATEHGQLERHMENSESSTPSGRWPNARREAQHHLYFVMHSGSTRRLPDASWASESPRGQIKLHTTHEAAIYLAYAHRCERDPLARQHRQ
jgi:hypothetical protein